MDKAKRIGMEAYKAELDEKVKILEGLLKDYNDGRSKSFYCLAVNLLELQDAKAVMVQIIQEVDLKATLKTRAAAAVRLFEEMAIQRGISLKLRK